MKKTIIALFAVAAMASCTKETKQSLNNELRYSQRQNTLSKSVTYQCESKDIGGSYNSEITFDSDSTFTLHFDRGSNYFTDYQGKYTLNEGCIVMKHKGLTVIKGIITFDKFNPGGFILTRGNGKVEVYYRK